MNIETVGKWRKEYEQRLENIYPEGEIRFLFRIVMEDLLGWKGKPPETGLSKEQSEILADAAERLGRHEPVQYITGKAYFYGQYFNADPRALIPRSETEEMVDMILKNEPVSQRSVLDIGTGSGCIAITLALERPAWQIKASDVSAPALDLARENAGQLNATVSFLQDDILAPAWDKHEEYDLIVSNPPYVPFSYLGAMDRNVKDYEPHQALFVQNDSPLEFYRAIEAFCRKKLKAGGALYMEINSKYSTELQNYFNLRGYDNIEVSSDISGRKRIMKMKKTTAI